MTPVAKRNDASSRPPPVEKLLEDLTDTAQKAERLAEQVKETLRKDARRHKLAATNDPLPAKPRRRRTRDRRKPQDV
jgi:hypothetical protein